MTIRFTAGFRVEQSVSLSTTKTCFADNDWVAVWNRVGRTSYKVRNGLFNSCTGTRPHGDVFLITSPNASSKKGGNPYCVRGKRYVRNLGIVGMRLLFLASLSSCVSTCRVVGRVRGTDRKEEKDIALALMMICREFK
ncbi:hypothetical protein B0H65DRAFT_188238 [Neurospora tetraspora]|uniref:Uncharacterized protein n=1 Tax=Neurospora tetraspora TaxID=94610 RepID=A0AAE0MRE6_9PEZI|nr:hypothetical protein B0H65DRAFT_188238 [Neurospora tetraspora]